MVTNLEDSITRYRRDLWRAIEAGDVDKLIDVISGKDAADMEPLLKQNSFLGPFGEHVNAFSAIASIELDDIERESEIAATVLASFGDDFTALQTIQDCIPRIQNEDVRDRYKTYAGIFAGTFAPIGSLVVNQNHVKSYNYNSSKGHLNVSDINGSRREHVMSEEAARAFIDGATERSDFIAINDIVLNLRHVKNIHLTNQGLGVRGNDKSLAKYKTTEEDAKAVIESLAEHPEFIIIGENAVNLRHTAKYDYNRDSGYFKIYYSDGDSIKIEMEPEDANAVIESLEAHPAFFKNINFDSITGTEYEDSYLLICNTTGTKPAFKREEAKAIIDSLVERPDFIDINGHAFNLNHITSCNQRGEHLWINKAKGGSSGIGMEAEEAKAIIDSLAKRPDFIDINGHAFNLNHITSCNQRGEHLWINKAKGGSSGIGMEAEEAKAIIDSLAKRPDFIDINGHAFNLNHIVVCGNDFQGLNISTTVKGRSSLGISEEEAKAKKHDLRQKGQQLELTDRYISHQRGQSPSLRGSYNWIDDFQSTDQGIDRPIGNLAIVISGHILSSVDNGENELLPPEDSFGLSCEEPRGFEI